MTSASASRATRSSRNLRLALLLALACAAGSAVLRAQETPPAATPTTGTAPAAGEEVIQFPDAPDPGAAPTRPEGGRPAPSGTPAAGPPPAIPAPAGADAADEDEPPPDATPRTPGVVGPTPGHFEPTEKVRADFDVSFPVDI